MAADATGAGQGGQLNPRGGRVTLANHLDEASGGKHAGTVSVAACLSLRASFNNRPQRGNAPGVKPGHIAMECTPI